MFRYRVPVMRLRWLAFSPRQLEADEVAAVVEVPPSTQS